jgi:hypothetical protein
MACSSSSNCSSSGASGCPDQYGCVPGVCPDFVIRRHDTKPSFKVKMEDCDGPLDLTDLVLEASMWAKTKLKTSLDDNDTVLAFADGIGFNQIMVGDVLLMEQSRLPEQMLVVGFDEPNKLVQVQRGYHGTPVQTWKKGAPLRILKFTNAPASTEMVYQDVTELDGTVTKDVLMDSFFIYDWQASDTCMPGCYYMEFKLMKMAAVGLILQSTVPSDQIPSNIVPSGITPSFTDPSYTPSTFACGLAQNIEWIRRFPVEGEGFIIKVADSPTVND